MTNEARAEGTGRGDAWDRLGGKWDVVVVGGGITGAGILLEAARCGWRALLVEQRDFAWGTSSRSSKLVHGGLRYLKQGDVRLTYEAVRERRSLVEEAPGLVEPLGFLVAAYDGQRLARHLFGVGLGIYDLMAGRRTHEWHEAAAFRLLAPHVRPGGLVGGFGYDDAQTDDARLVLRVLREARALGATAVNYVAADGLLRASGGVAGLAVRDVARGRTAEVRAPVVVSATGAWADRLRGELGRGARLRPLRGSHLTFPAWRLPAAQALMFLHPADRRPIFVIPWEGVTLVGTTDLDHARPLDEEPSISPREVDYLMVGLRGQFPSLALEAHDVVATFAGVRPVVGTGKTDPSKESRDHVVWEEDGLLTVTGGKLTTFRLIARDALRAVRRRLPRGRIRHDGPMLPPPAAPLAAPLDPRVARRLLGRHGALAADVVAAAGPGEWEAVPGTETPWAELRWAARAEDVVHLDDLLLRRTRLGLLLARGGEDLLPRVRAIAQPELGWDDARWEREEAAYRALWRSCYGLPGRDGPDPR